MECDDMQQVVKSWGHLGERSVSLEIKCEDMQQIINLDRSVHLENIQCNEMQQIVTFGGRKCTEMQQIFWF